MLALSALSPALLAAWGASSSPPASHDEGVVRTVGLGWTGLFRGLDVMLAAPTMLLPLGTRAWRAGLASAIVTGLCGALAFVVARRLAMAVRPIAADARLVSAVCAAAVLAALLGPLWQAEASAPGGAVAGAAIVLAAIATAQRDRPDARAIGFAIGLGASYEPMVGIAAIVALAPSIAEMRRADRRSEWKDAALAFGIGLAPMAVAGALARRAPELALAASPWAIIGEAPSASVGLGAIRQWAVSEIGVVALLAGAAGAGLAIRSGAARRWLASIGAVVALGLFAISRGAAAGPSRVSPVVLAGVLGLYVFAAIALTAAVVAIARTKVPFARASAALVVVLELVLPARAVDETFSRREARAPNATAHWNEIAWGDAPPAAVLLVSDPATMKRVASSRAVGQLRRDLLVVPTFAVPSRQAARALVAEPKLAPLYRDIALGVAPEELSLAQLAAHRALLATFDPRWDRNLARHFVPVGLTSRFEPEPRGASDRRRALDAFSPSKDRLVRIAVAKRDHELSLTTAAMLRLRAVGIAACGERDVLSHALDDLRPFAPDDATANALVRRIVTSKGPIEIRDLTP
ncbi:MAG: hypothetical protein KF819_03280 [Labilithrix sp.]|nr:hypothetical protein [Labilithrix sp.]